LNKGLKMRFSFIYPAGAQDTGNLARGAGLLLYPNQEILQVANFIPEGDFSYFDERVERLPWEKLGEVILIYTPLIVPKSKIREMAEAIRAKGKVVILFGPRISIDEEMARGFSFVRGNILNCFGEIKQDLKMGRLAEVYNAKDAPTYLLPRWDLMPHFFSRYQSTTFILGCFCPKQFRPFCTQALYYNNRIKKREKEEIIGEIITLPHKRVFLQDEDIAADVEYYREIFFSLWSYKKEWIVNASMAILDYPDYLTFLSKVGVRVIFLTEDFITSDELYSLDERLAKKKRREVKRIQSERMLVGLRIGLFLKEGVFYEPIARNLRLIDPDFIELRFFQKDKEASLVYLSYHPLITPQEPLWLKSSFYSFRHILSRLLKRPRRVGLYTTLFYSLPFNLAYRQNFLEGIPYPP